jgi:hypothetical protein
MVAEKASDLIKAARHAVASAHKLSSATKP